MTIEQIISEFRKLRMENKELVDFINKLPISDAVILNTDYRNIENFIKEKLLEVKKETINEMYNNAHKES